jgi:hypothetical protein
MMSEESVEWLAGERKYCPSGASCTTNPTWPDAGRLSYGSDVTGSASALLSRGRACSRKMQGRRLANCTIFQGGASSHWCHKRTLRNDRAILWRRAPLFVSNCLNVYVLKHVSSRGEHSPQSQRVFVHPVNITIPILGIIRRTVFCLKLKISSIGLSVPRRKHITSALRAQQVKYICRFVRKVY